MAKHFWALAIALVGLMPLTANCQESTSTDAKAGLEAELPTSKQEPPIVKFKVRSKRKTGTGRTGPVNKNVRLCLDYCT